MKLFKIFFIVFIAQQMAWATFTITGVSGGSFSELTSQNTAVLYGGIAGQCDTNSTTSTCNTCNTNSVEVCNQKNINPLLQFSANITTGEPWNNVLVLMYSDTDDSLDTQVGGSSLRVTAAASQSVNIATGATWGEVCATDGNFGSNTCVPQPSSVASGVANFDANRKIYIWADIDGDGTKDDGEVQSFAIKLNHIDRGVSAVQNQTFLNTQVGCSAQKGFCGFTLDTPGDEKLYFKEFFSSATTPLNFASSPDWYGVALFHAQTATASNTITNSSSLKIIPFGSDYQVSESSLTGLTNYMTYCVLMANVNKAQNIVLFNINGTPAQSCAKPSEVIGLLDDKHCFISTAAFGSDMVDEVATFRKFRNEFLLTNALGAGFVKAYYKHGPGLAEFISGSELLKAITRTVLYPFYIFSVLSLRFGLLAALFVFALVFVFVCRFKLIFLGLFAAFKNRPNRKTFGMIFFFVFAFSFFKAVPAQAVDGFTKTRTEQRPGATADGLVRIDKDGNYIYKLPPQNVSQASHLKLGYISNPEISSTICQNDNASNCQTVNYEDIYQDATGMALEYIYDYFFMKTKGKLGLQVGFAAQYAEGNGRLASDPTKPSIESFSFIAVPLYGGVVYRFEYKDRQLFVPYVSAGGTYLVLAEKREDKSSANFVGAPGFYASGGGLLNLSALDRDMGADFETEYDIKNLWLTAEFKYVSVTSDAFALQSGFFQAGMAFDF